MNKRAIGIFVAVVLLAAAAAVYFLYVISGTESEIPDPMFYAETEEESDTGLFPIDGSMKGESTVTLSPPETGDTGTSSYLLEADFVLSEENLKESLMAFFSSPCVLDFYLEDAGSSGVYRCEDAGRNRDFGAVFTSVNFSVISMRKYDAAVAAGSVENPYHEASYRRAYFANELGQVSLIIGGDGTYLDFYLRKEGGAERTESGRTFFTETDLYDDLLAVKNAMGEGCVPLN